MKSAIHHLVLFFSDRGAQYTSHRFQQLLHEHNTKQSFSQPGKPHDNAVAESFFASLKKEELYRKDHPSDRAFQASVASYIEFYNTKTTSSHIEKSDAMPHISFAAGGRKFVAMRACAIYNEAARDL